MCAPVRLFLTSQALAALAGSMMLLALGVWAKQLTDSSTLAGLCTAAATTPRLLGIFLGESLDRLPRRTALLGADLGTVAALALLWVVQHDEQYWPLPVFGVVYGTLGVLAHTASPGALKAITTPEETPRAVSVLQVVNGTVLIVGPVTGTAVLGVTLAHRGHVPSAPCRSPAARPGRHPASRRCGCARAVGRIAAVVGGRAAADCAGHPHPGLRCDRARRRLPVRRSTR